MVTCACIGMCRERAGVRAKIVRRAGLNLSAGKSALGASLSLFTLASFLSSSISPFLTSSPTFAPCQPPFRVGQPLPQWSPHHRPTTGG